VGDYQKAGVMKSTEPADTGARFSIGEDF
jgi:ribonucleoside-diphosphate reductase beta chain